MGSPDCNVSMVDINLRKHLWVYCPGHAGVKGNDRADRLAGQGTVTSGLRPKLLLRQTSVSGGRGFVAKHILLSRISLLRQTRVCVCVCVCVCVRVCACVVFSWNIYLCFPPGHFFFFLFFPLKFNVCIYDCGCMWCALILVRCV